MRLDPATRLAAAAAVAAALLTGLCHGLDDGGGGSGGSGGGATQRRGIERGGLWSRRFDDDGYGDLFARDDNESNAIVQMLPNYPDCSRPCFVSGLEAVPCFDTPCVCADQGFRHHIKACVIQSCSRLDALVTKNMTDTGCGRPRRDQSGKLNAVSISFGSVAAVVVAVRLAFKAFRRRWGIDDAIIAGAIALGIPCTVLTVQGLVRNGLGRDVWTLHAETISDFTLFFFFLEILYLAMMSMVRTAMCFFYLSIFPGLAIRRLLWVTATVNVLLGLASVLTAVFQCSPVSYFWAMYTTHEGGSCIDIHVLGWVHAGINIAMNLWLVALPLSQVYGLGLDWKKKAGVVIMFLTGAVDTVVSGLRLQSLIYFANSWNPTWDQSGVVWWSIIEINIGLICTCLPTLRLLLMQLAPHLLSSRWSPSRRTSPNGTASSQGIMVQKQVRVSSIDAASAVDTVTASANREPWEAPTSEDMVRPMSAAYTSGSPRRPSAAFSSSTVNPHR